jgi:hypothetical protein
MTRLAAITLLATCTWGCGGAYYPGAAQTAAYESAPEADYAEAGGEAGGIAYGREEYRFADDDIGGDLATPSSTAITSAEARPASPSKKGGSYQSDGAKQQQQQQNQQSRPPPAAEKRKNELEQPLVVYTGYLQLRVKRLLDAVDEIERITTEKGGYIESRTKDVVVVRVPASDFDTVLDTFSRVGELLGRRVKALDVSEQFTDLGARLAVAREARMRLLALLERVTDVDERLQILREVKRLSELIESYESTLATLRNLVDYFTITIELVPIMDDRAIDTHSSPFPWVRALAAHLASIEDGKNEFALPPGFVLFDEDDCYRAQAADTTIIRGGVVDNEPLGDSAFWADAVNHELHGRAETIEDQGVSGAIHYRVFRSDDVQPRYYLVGVAAREGDVHVIEVFYPDEESYAAHHQAMVAALATFEVR